MGMFVNVIQWLRGGFPLQWKIYNWNYWKCNKEATQGVYPDVMEKKLVKNAELNGHFGGTWERLIWAFKIYIEAMFVTNRYPTDEIP